MSTGKWDVYKSFSGVWVAYQIGSAYNTTYRPFDTHAEALAYAIEQAEAGR